MVIGKVVGTVVATRKHDRLIGGKIQVIQPLEPSSMEPDGALFVAIDAVGAGIGEQVLIARGSAARKAIDNESAPVDATIVGIIDEVDIPNGRPGKH
jgi:ethanolamine utilization protein EutN